MAMNPERWAAERPHLPWPLVAAAPSSMDVRQIYDPQMWRIREPGRTVHGGFVLPPFQRPPVWDERRQARYVESVYLGLHGMPIVWNDAGEEDGPDGSVHETDGWLIDGQQRIGAIIAYVDNRIEVFTDGVHAKHRHRWADLNGAEQGVFSRRQIPTVRITSSDPEMLHDIYLRLAFGGVPHKPV